MDVALEVAVNEYMHDREIRIDKKPDSWFSVGANDLSLRRCLETKVDIYRKGVELAR